MVMATARVRIKIKMDLHCIAFMNPPLLISKAKGFLDGIILYGSDPFSIEPPLVHILCGFDETHAGTHEPLLQGSIGEWALDTGIKGAPESIPVYGKISPGREDRQNHLGNGISSGSNPKIDRLNARVAHGLF